ncbi:response regulator transcription factor (plasmid) [Trichlorobacter lovleyi]|uniref:response regulator transcription factor n=1 Tax=Trichlorobacter lovleyi TaxID=313985 RepID=UPI0022400BCC|nr:response regulator transcription factor [Trichlorobacter lovleyi]QOX81047.1 response regulator transcription factor [Trichlorobacter lovleyi]
MQKLPMLDGNNAKINTVSPRILFVDDHSIVRHGVSVLLNGAFGNHIQKSEAGSGLEAIEILKQKQFDLLIVDISMPGMNGLELLAEIKSKKLSDAPVIIYSMYTEEQFAVQAFSLGAAGYVAKHAASKELVGAVKKVLNGGRYVSETLSQLLLDHLTGIPAQPRQLVQQPSSPQSTQPLPAAANKPEPQASAIHKLSKKEIEVLLLFTQGLTPKEIGEKLGRSEKTVSAHKLSAVNKLGVDDFSDVLSIVKQAKRDGLI